MTDKKIEEIIYSTIKPTSYDITIPGSESFRGLLLALVDSESEFAPIALKVDAKWPYGKYPMFVGEVRDYLRDKEYCKQLIESYRKEKENE